MEEEYDDSAPAKMPRISFFDADVSEMKEILQKVMHKKKLNMHGYDSNISHCYDMSDAFSTTDSYWMSKVQSERFRETYTRGILYRPDIANEMKQLVDTCLNQEGDDAHGIMIKGPRGIGKSHSIVNLVRKLLYDSDGKYLVTFIPNCSSWNHSRYLYDAICCSLGCTRSDLGFDYPSERTTLFGEFIEAVDSFLADKGMKWVFIFDRIDRLFAQIPFKLLKHVGALPFPFMAMKSVMKTGRITSIISTSNEIPYRNCHPGFIEYNHPCRMSTVEINVIYPEITMLSEEDRNKVYQVTGCVPLQLIKLVTFDFSFKEYKYDSWDLLQRSILELQCESSYEVLQRINKSVVACLLSIDGNELNYDCRYTIRSRQGTKYHYDALFPLVLVAYRRFFWDEILMPLKVSEGPMLLACKNKHVTSDTCSQLFDLVVINRCSTCVNVELDIAWDFPRVLNCTLVGTFDYMTLPSVMEENGMYVPLHSNFPAIDLIWKCDKSVCGVQVHVAAHQGSVEEFEKLCTEAGWFRRFEHVYMLFLSPTRQIASMVQHYVCQQQGRIIVAAASIHNVSCLDDLQWPDMSNIY